MSSLDRVPPGGWLNAAAYAFTPLDDLKRLRAWLLERTRAAGLKGTVLLSTEGINLFLAGEPTEVEQVLDELRQRPGLQSLSAKLSRSDQLPFRRMLVKIKREIIPFGVPGIDPSRERAPSIEPVELRQWLDSGRPCHLLDARNDYEIKLGTFRGAVGMNLEHFRDFPRGVDELPTAWREEPIVTFCTGGIRCEKGALYLIRAGFRNVFQLEGGILRYFEECGGAHFDGECFVFDQRVGVDSGLVETRSDYCGRCQTPLTPEEQSDPRYVPWESCPHCFVPSDERQAIRLAERHEQLRRVTTPLPGSRPSDNLRPVLVPGRCAGWTLLDFLCHILPHIPRAEWAACCAAGEMVDPRGEPVSAERVVQPGERYARRCTAEIEPSVSTDVRIVYEDEALVVVDKPAPLPTHPCGRFHRNTLQLFLEQVYRPQKPRPAHRLDANTQGIVIFTRTRHVASRLQPQFERGEVEKVYRARVEGHPPVDHFSCDAPIRATSGDLGLRDIEPDGLEAHTDFTVLERRADGTSLVEVRPSTGRTHQIRIHLWSLGWPIVGDRSYLAGGRLGDRQTLDVDEPPLCLWAERLTFRHPLSGQRVTFSATPPDWARYEVSPDSSRPVNWSSGSRGA